MEKLYNFWIKIVINYSFISEGKKLKQLSKNKVDKG